MYCYLEFKLSYLKNLKLFSIRVKELFEPIVLRKKRRRVFALFKSIFLRNRSSSNARWFYTKKVQIEKGNLYWTKNRLSRNEMWCAADNYNYMCHPCAKRFLDSNLNEAVIDKIPIFTKLSQISHIRKNHNFSSLIGRFYTNCFYPINFMAGICEEYPFSFFSSCKSLRPTQIMLTVDITQCISNCGLTIACKRMLSSLCQRQHEWGYP